jgi:hypothetical protein
VKIPNAVVLQLHHLSRDDDRGEAFVTGLDQLGADLAGVVPSLLAVSLTLVRFGHDVVVPVLASNASTTEVSASLAVPLSAGELGDVLVLFAAEPGAFLLLAHDLAGLVGPGDRSLEVDRHLPAAATASPTRSAASFALALSEMEDINQAIGALVDQGVPGPQAALDELAGRAAVAGSTIATVSRRLLADLWPPPAGDSRATDLM